MSKGITTGEGILLGLLYPGTLILAITLSNTLANDNHMQSNNDTPTQDLFNAYHAACNAAHEAAKPLYKRALYELEASLEYTIGCLQDDQLRPCANGLRDDVLDRILEQTLQCSDWTFVNYKAAAVYDGADACGDAHLLDGDEDGPCQQAHTILSRKLQQRVDEIAQRLWDSRVENGFADA